MFEFLYDLYIEGEDCIVGDMYVECLDLVFVLYCYLSGFYLLVEWGY